jgi:hypothetical protein
MFYSRSTRRYMHLILLFLLFCGLACKKNTSNPPPSKIVVTVNGKTITFDKVSASFTDTESPLLITGGDSTNHYSIMLRFARTKTGTYSYWGDNGATAPDYTFNWTFTDNNNSADAEFGTNLSVPKTDQINGKATLGQVFSNQINGTFEGTLRNLNTQAVSTYSSGTIAYYVH